jgi:Uma2 family endonuclease
MAIAPIQLITADEFLRMSFEHPVELDRGEIVEMPPASFSHGIVCGRFFLALSQWSQQTGTPVLLASNDSAVLTSRSPDTVRGADVVLIRRSRLSGDSRRIGVLAIPPDLVVEVLSPSDRLPAVMVKVTEYLQAGGAEVWVVDPEDRLVDVHNPSRRLPARFGGDQPLTSPELLPGFSCPVSEFFADA